ALSKPTEIVRPQEVFSILTDANPSLKETGAPPFVKNYARIAKIRANQWKYCDYDGDGALDLIIGIGDWNDYGMEWGKDGWENAYDKDGRWKNGPLHGYVYLMHNKGTNAEPSYAPPEKV